ncbi:MAG: SIR2 family protein [Chloroflexi bacterium]|nr:SIR2 family protein [Chloroflexota bacterium]
MLRLFRSANDVRLVTTNFDQHFTMAATETFARPFGQPPATYHAPALPLGDRFNGIVYLHGCVEQDPDELILTDRDFGRAYLTEGWARRFLQSMFTKFTVLFVGYSHTDPVIYHLARALPPESTSRFVLVGEPNAEELARWNQLGIAVVRFAIGQGTERYAALPSTIEDWGNRISEAYRGREQQIGRIVAVSAELDPTDNSYLEWALSDTATVKFFTARAKGTYWLQWADQRGYLNPLFLPGATLDDREKLLAEWFSREFAAIHAPEALALVQRHGARITSDSSIARS